jgi:hypothetical protein
VLARLQEESAVEAAEVDRRGELLRLRLESSSDIGGVVALLLDLGFAGEVVSDAQVSDAPLWYGLESVGELSREEGKVIAERVVPAFARLNGIESGNVEALKNSVATALHACFVRHTLGPAAPHGALNDACDRAVEKATTARLGPDRAAALGRAIESDLASRSAFKG